MDFGHGAVVMRCEHAAIAQTHDVLGALDPDSGLAEGVERNLAERHVTFRRRQRSGFGALLQSRQPDVMPGMHTIGHQQSLGSRGKSVLVLLGQHPAAVGPRLDEPGVIDIQEQALAVPGNALVSNELPQVEATGTPKVRHRKAAPDDRSSPPPSICTSLLFGYQLGHDAARIRHAQTAEGGAAIAIWLLTCTAVLPGE